MGNAMMTVAAIWDPAAQHVVDERLEYDADEADDDDPVNPPDRPDAHDSSGR